MEQQFKLTKGMKYGIGLVSLILLFFIFCFRTVGVGQVGILTSFGHITKQQGSGVMIKAPWPIQRLHTFDVKIQKDQADAAASSQDLQDVHATVVTNYHIDPSKVGSLYTNVGTQYKERIIDPAIQESVKATTAQFPIADLVTKRTQLKDEITSSLRQRLEKNGIYIDDISITNLTFSPEYTKAIESKQVAQQQAEQAKFNLEKAQQDAQANQVQQAALTEQILRQQAIAKWDGHLPSTVSTTDGAIFSIPLK